MTKIFAALALAALAVSPALAATKHRPATEPMASSETQNAYVSGYAYATVNPNDRDPDPFIRNSVQLQLNADQLGNN